MSNDFLHSGDAARTGGHLWQKAVSFAARRHHGQMRKDGVTPYVAHPFRVAFTVRHVFEVDDPVALCVALLHDVIEDTTTDFDDVCAEFGEEIAAAVACLTKDKRLPEDERVSENGDRHPTSCASTHLHPQHPGASPRFRTAS